MHVTGIVNCYATQRDHYTYVHCTEGNAHNASYDRRQTSLIIILRLYINLIIFKYFREMVHSFLWFFCNK